MVIKTDRKGLEKLVRDNSVVLADFYADWCGSCKMMEKVLEEFDKANSGSVVTVRLDAEAEKKEMEDLSIETLPTLILYKQGEEYIRVRGARTKAELERLLTI